MMYKTILADPPWLEQGGGECKRGANRHYDLMNTEKIIEYLQEELRGKLAEDAHLYLCVTNNFLLDGLKVVEALGFRYITLITWFKDRIGLGQYFRGLSEHIIFAVKGRAMVPDLKGVTAFYEAKREHSRKPDKMYRMIEDVSPEPRIELFARCWREGWTVRGLEIPTAMQTTLF